jgi:hypothetical protein
MLAALGMLADALLAIAALYVSGQALRGYWKEHQAKTEQDDDEKRSLQEDAKTLYASASLSLPWLLCFIFVGTGLKVLLMLWSLIKPYL